MSGAKQMKTIFGITMIAAGLSAPGAAQQTDDTQAALDRALAAAKSAQQYIDSPAMQEQIDRAMAMAKKAMDQAQPQMEQLKQQLRQLQMDRPNLLPDADALQDLKFRLDGMLALEPQTQADLAREKREQARDARERARDSEERDNDLYRSGTELVDNHRYDRAIEQFDRVIASKSTRADGAYYWKAYALEKLGKRDEALTALAEIPKQFPHSRWINDANALRVEIQQSSGNPVSPESQANEDLKLLAINALMNSEPDRAIPLLEKVLNDPKNDLGLKSRALFVLAQSRGDKGRDIVLQYAKSGANPDLQIRAITYLGTYRSKDSQQALAEVYAANADIDVRRAALRSMAISHDSAHLFAAAKSESNPDLRHEAIRALGTMQASNELAQLYASETNNDLKEAILSALMVTRDADRLIEIAKTEKNPELRADAIRYLSNARSDKAADAMVAIYASEPDKNVKAQIIRGLGIQSAGKQLVEVTRTEKDPELKKVGVEWLGRMHGSKEATDYLMEIINK